MPSLAHTSIGRARLRRRIVTIPGVFLVTALLLLLLVPVLVIGGLIDICYRRPLSTVRLILFTLWWLLVESFGLIAGFILWGYFRPGKRLANQRSIQAHTVVQRIWIKALVTAARLFLGLKIKVEGDSLENKVGPFIILARHGSQGDALLIAAMLGRLKIRPRVILKKELLQDPCFDVFGNRLRNYFVDRDTVDNFEEIASIGQLAAEMNPDEATLIFPEGTRFSLPKLKKSIASLQATAPSRVKSAKNLRSVLPIRSPGILAVLKNAPEANLIFINHVGVSQFRSIKDIWRNTPLPTDLHFNITFLPRNEAPDSASQDELIKFIDSRWEEIDDWVVTNQQALS